jgi:capsular polysaccharide biosynthesis protein
MLETFLRRWLLFLLPVVVLGAFGVYSVLAKGTTYRSTGVIQVNTDTLLSTLSVINANGDFGGDTPATYTARQLNTLLGTDRFLDEVITNAGVQSSVENGALTRQQVRRSVAAQAGGDELVGVSAATSNPELSFRLADSAIRTYKDWETDHRVTDSQATIDVLKDQIARQQQNIDQAIAEGALAPTITGLREDLNAMRTDLDKAEREQSTAAAQIDQTLTSVDEPVQPTAPESSRSKDIQTVLMFLVLGAVVGGAALVVVTITDRSVRYAEEIESRFQLPVLASIPTSPALTKPTVR